MSEGVRSALLVAVALASLGCGASEGAEPASEPPPLEPAPVEPARVDPAPIVQAQDSCEAHRAAFRAAMATATGTCASATDCGCFGPVVGEAGCGGITDAATAGRLSTIQTAFRAEGCPWPHQCGPWSCQPTCREGRCVNSASGGRLLP